MLLQGEERKGLVKLNTRVRVTCPRIFRKEVGVPLNSSACPLCGEIVGS